MAADLSNYRDDELEEALRRKRQQDLSSIPDEVLQQRLAQLRQPEPSMLRRAYEAVAGNAAEDLPSVYGGAFAEQNERAGKRAGFQGLASVFGDDEDVAKAIQRDHPGSRMDQDANGNPVLVTQDGQRFYINPPGLDAMDAGRFAGKVASFIPAGRLATWAGGLAGRMALGSVGAGATDAAMQVAAGRSTQDYSLQQTAQAAAGGAAAEVVMPLVNAARVAWRGRAAAKPQQLQLGHSIAAKAGTEVPDDVALALARRSDEIQAGADPLAVIAEERFGFSLSRGQRTGNKDVLAREEFLRELDPNGPLGAAARGNAQQHAQNLTGLRTTLARGQPVATEQEAARRAQDALKAAEAAKRGQVRQAYQQADAAGGGIALSADDIAAIPGQIDRKFRGEIYISPEVTPNAHAARRVLGEFTEDAAERGAPLSLKDVEEMRKRVGKFRAGNLSAQDERAIGAMIRELDGSVHSAVTKSLIDGGPEALAALKSARGVASRYFAQFQGNTPAGKQLTKMLADEATPEQVAQMLIGANGVNAAGAASIAQRYMRAVGRDSDGANALRDMVGRRLLTSQPGDDVVQSAAMTDKLLREALHGKGNTLMGALFTKTELQLLSDYQRIMRQFFVTTPDDFAKAAGRSSGSAQNFMRFMKYLNQSPLSKLPFGNYMAQAVSGVAARVSGGSSMRALPIARPAAVPAAGAAAGGLLADERERRR